MFAFRGFRGSKPQEWDTTTIWCVYYQPWSLMRDCWEHGGQKLVGMMTKKCWSISQQWWMNWRTGTSWGNGVVFSCQISEIWFHGIGNTVLQIYISCVYVYSFKQLGSSNYFMMVRPNFPAHTLLHVYITLLWSMYIHVYMFLFKYMI